MKKFFKQVRKGFSLVELLIAVVVLGILGAMLLAAGTAAQTKARVAVASNDIDSVRNAVYTAFTMKTSFMQMHDSEATFKSIVEAINAELDENWEWEPIGGGASYPASSGAVAQTKVQRDPWGNPYTMYIYTDDWTTTYASGRGGSGGTGTIADQMNTPLVDADSCIYLVIASAGPNGSGVGMGSDGQNGLAGGATPTASAANCVNNTDGIDDIGVVVRMLNGSTTMATFGWANASLGTLEFTNWYFCGQKAGASPAGVYTELQASGAVGPYGSGGGATVAGSSLDLFPNTENLKQHHNGAKNASKNAPAKIQSDWVETTT